MYKIFTIFIAVIITSCLAQRPLRYRNKRIPYEDDDYRDNNGDYDDDRQNDLRDMRPHEHQSGNRFNPLHDMNRQTHFDVGGGRDPPEFFRGYGLPAKPFLQPQIQPQPQPQAAQQSQHPQSPQQSQQPQQLGGPYDARAGGFGYNPYGHYTYNPYGFQRPGYYGWNRPQQTADPWRGSYGLGFPFNLLLGGGGARPWWSNARFPFGLF